MRNDAADEIYDDFGGFQDDDRFYETFQRLSSAVTDDFASSDSENGEDFEDSRTSFASSMSSASFRSIYSVDSVGKTSSEFSGYDMWISEPGDVRERRKRLLQSMGIASSEHMIRIPLPKGSIDGAAAGNGGRTAVEAGSRFLESSRRDDEVHAPTSSSSSIPHSYSRLSASVFVQSRPNSDMDTVSAVLEQSKGQSISSGKMVPNVSYNQDSSSNGITAETLNDGSLNPKGNLLRHLVLDGGFDSYTLIKNLDTGKEFIVKEYIENHFCDVHTGELLTTEEFEKSVGYSALVKKLMHQQKNNGHKVNFGSYLNKNFRNRKSNGSAILKSFKGSRSGLDKDQEQSSQDDHKHANPNLQWVKVRQQGKSYKEFTALHMSQDIQAHAGSIRTMIFSCDGCFLASAGEDKVIHVWEVQKCEVELTGPDDDASSTGGTPVHPMSVIVSDGGPSLPEPTLVVSDKKSKSKSSRTKDIRIPYHVKLPETLFTLSEKPICTFSGHRDQVLDLSWSKSQHLLSSSMDKTVRLWDLDTKSCLKIFTHNDYVTCVQFNPVDENYFISGSLDAKVRIWNIPDHRVVDWTDIHEMVTAISYTPDGQDAIIGSHRGTCRIYSIDECKLVHQDTIQIMKKGRGKKLPGFYHRHVQPSKITGIEFSPSGNLSKVLISSTDSRIRMYDGSDVIQKFKGFRNSSSQISASISPNGQHVISASEDSQVYIWKVDKSKNDVHGKKKGRVIVQAYERFPCKDISVAIPWPGRLNYRPPLSYLHDQTGVTLKKSDSLESNNCCCANTDPANSSSSNGDSSSISGSESRASSFKFENGTGHGRGHNVPAVSWGLVIITASLEGKIRVYQNFGLPLKC